MTMAIQNRPRDPNTFSNYNEFITNHIQANFSIDFEKKNLIGNVVLKLRPVTTTESKEIVLDTSYLDIKEIKVDGYPSNWDLLPRTEPFGSVLKITLGKPVGETESVEIDVGSEEESHLEGANRWYIQLSWRLNCRPLRNAPLYNGSHQLKHRAGNIHSYVSQFPPQPSLIPLLIIHIVSQCQAIHARSIFPCQDTPDVKSTYEFNIRSPLPVIASGLFTGTKDFQPGKNGTQGTLLYTFKQDIPIPSYLFAIASGWVSA